MPHPATRTATIRVDASVRDQLAAAARRQGISLSELLRRHAREEFFAAERAAFSQDLQNPEFLAELDDWDTTVGDGID